MQKCRAHRHAGAVFHHIDARLVQLCDRCHQGQPEAVAGRCPATVEPIQPPEDALAFLRRNSWAVVADPGNDHPIDLSAGAARQLGYDSPQTIAVRVRRITPTSSDQAALMQGRPATQRPDTPAVLLTALRKHLPANNYAAAAPAQPSQSRPAPPARPAATTRAPSGRGYFVQVAALSNARNAQSLAQSMGGFVKPGGGLHRVQIGPFATPAQADAARRRAAGAGYKDARVFAN